jgi:hypothetical protein
MSTAIVTMVNWASPETFRTGVSSFALELSQEAAGERHKWFHGCAMSSGTRRGVFACFRRFSLERDALHFTVLIAPSGGGVNMELALSRPWHDDVENYA